MNTPAQDDCPTCHGKGHIDLPRRWLVEEGPCPTCHPWPQGFPGLLGHNGWVIEPYPAQAAL